MSVIAALASYFGLQDRLPLARGPDLVTRTEHRPGGGGEDIDLVAPGHANAGDADSGLRTGIVGRQPDDGTVRKAVVLGVFWPHLVRFEAAVHQGFLSCDLKLLIANPHALPTRVRALQYSKMRRTPGA